ncbi:MAG: flagellar hook-length control protein FliK [Sulfurimonas sp.]|nr:flagellar hook-length control protein FliK [Sulfurimonas sp.]
MILVDSKAEAKTILPIKLSTPNEKLTLSFGELLKGVNIKGELKKEPKLIQDGALVLSLDNEIKNVKNSSKGDKKLDGLLSLLQNENVKLKDEPLGLNPKITQNLTPKEVKQLINTAKNYLRQQILQSDGYKQSQIKELPQTLKGLATLAKKFDIDISKITLEQVQIKPNSKTKEISVDIPKTKEQLKTNNTNETLEVKQEVKQDVKSDKKSTKTVSNSFDGVEVNEKKDIKADIKIEIKATQRIDEKLQNGLKQAPIFIAKNRAEIVTTQQIVLAKQFQPMEEKTPKQRADNTLKLLLRGEKPAQSSVKLTADFSVDTAKVIAPKMANEIPLANLQRGSSFESLLRGESGTQSTDNLVKAEQINIHKADSFEVKLNEARQMIKYLSSDVKTAIEDYKSPFTRIKVQLNPQNLGTVDLTVVQRGKNLHVNITSNNIAINALALNVNDLKVQLANNGINNATFNFNSSSENSSSNNSHQQNSHNEQNRANEEYNYFDNEEQNEEILSSLEIIIPNYA